MSYSWRKRSFEVGQVFTPGAPINERDLFSGRINQVGKVIDTITQTGYHGVLYGERGVGKTSLSNVLSSFIQGAGKRFYLPRVNCDALDTFTTLWKKLFNDFTITKRRPGIGFLSETTEEVRRIVDDLPETLTPDDVRRTLDLFSDGIILVPIIDEFDRIKDRNTSNLMADTIKALSDYSVDTTILIIGVADSVDELIREHQSIERTLVQISLPRMSRLEVKEIVENGMKRLKMKIHEGENNTIVNLSQGLPYVAHLLSLHATKVAIKRKSEIVEQEDVQHGITMSLENWQQSIKSRYYNATKSQQPGNILKQVVLACACAKNDDFGYFTAANIRDSLQLIVPEKSYQISHFTRHLKQLSGSERGFLLSRSGKKRRLRYRFNSPLMSPYIIMKGFDDGMVTSDVLPQLGEYLKGSEDGE